MSDVNTELAHRGLPEVDKLAAHFQLCKVLDLDVKKKRMFCIHW